MTATNYHMSHATFIRSGAPFIADIVTNGMSDPCPVCERERKPPSFNVPLTVTLDQKKGSYWPDLLGSAESIMVISDAVVTKMAEHFIQKAPFGKVEIKGKYPGKLKETMPPQYHWIDGWQLRYLQIDFLASGFVEAEKCRSCDLYNYNVSKTYDRHREMGGVRYVLKNSIPESAAFFTCNLSPTLFFCSQKFVEFARENRFTNFDFRPADVTLG
jgi:hypothetical protein